MVIVKLDIISVSMVGGYVLEDKLDGISIKKVFAAATDMEWPVSNEHLCCAENLNMHCLMIRRQAFQTLTDFNQGTELSLSPTY